ncbi:SGNH/GDSL hydrolase family protein [Proteus mirabilis]|uniref:SGNH/GDSL hydrolase family protein n=1 Tax=Proteus mirabilis TaxID=584 RepID=UPI00195374A2
MPHIYLLTDEAIGLGPESTVDGIHPNDIGMMQYAIAYEKIIRKILLQAKK